MVVNFIQHFGQVVTNQFNKMPLDISIPRQIVIDGGNSLDEEEKARKKQMKKSSKDRESSRSSRRKSKSEKKERERKERKEKHESSGDKHSRRHKKKSKSHRRNLSTDSDSIDEEVDFLLDSLLDSDGENLKSSRRKSRKVDSDNEPVNLEDRYGRVVHSSDEDNSKKPVRHGNIVSNEIGMNPFEDADNEPKPAEKPTAAPVVSIVVKPSTNPFDGASSDEYDEEEDEDVISIPPLAAEKESGKAGQDTNEDNEEEGRAGGHKDLATKEVGTKEKTSGEKALDNIATSLGSMFTTLSHKRSESENSSSKHKVSSLLKPKVPFLGNLMRSKSDVEKKNSDKQAYGLSEMKDWSNPFSVDKSEKDQQESDLNLVKTLSTDDGVETSIVGSNVDEKELEDVSLNTGDHGGLKRTPTDTTRNESSEDSRAEDEEDDDDEEEDIVESSKRLLRMADQRLQYQKSNDEIKKLKMQLDEMREQSAALTEQLRRAIETKCDLVLAQTELERFHEQVVLCKDDEIKDLRDFNNDLMEKTSNLEMKLMLEVGSLTQRLNDMDRKHRNEVLEKDCEIAQLEQKLSMMRSESVRSGDSRTAFKSRFQKQYDQHHESPPNVECA